MLYIHSPFLFQKTREMTTHISEMLHPSTLLHESTEIPAAEPGRPHVVTSALQHSIHQRRNIKQ